MKRRNTQTLGEVLRDFFEDNTELYEKIIEIRIQRAWGEVLGSMVLQYTRNLYVKDKVLHVSLSSSVLRSELLLCKPRLVKSLNEYVGAQALTDIVLH
ncbi:MAG: DUF721 domain-containing protein [Tannerellaceae bacterium]|nr:DUF721 domain-containing protein [Tannerellaceae bacterium]